MQQQELQEQQQLGRLLLVYLGRSREMGWHVFCMQTLLFWVLFWATTQDFWQRPWRNSLLSSGKQCYVCCSSQIQRLNYR